MMPALAADNRISAPAVDALLSVALIPLAGPVVGLLLAGLATQSGALQRKPETEAGAVKSLIHRADAVLSGEYC